MSFVKVISIGMPQGVEFLLAGSEMVPMVKEGPVFYSEYMLVSGARGERLKLTV